MRLIFATNNSHKLREIKQVIGTLCTICTPADVGLKGEIPEDFDTLEANSLQKAEYIYAATGSDCFADDTGLEVEILNGAPCVYSARYAGPQCSPRDNMRKLLAQMEGQNHRTARFRTVISLILNGERYQFEGVVDGEILTVQTGEGGFGYDPIFRPIGYSDSFAQMSPELKNSLSHRGRAVTKMVNFLKEQLAQC